MLVFFNRMEEFSHSLPAVQVECRIGWCLGDPRLTRGQVPQSATGWPANGKLSDDRGFSADSDL